MSLLLAAEAPLSDYKYVTSLSGCLGMLQLLTKNSCCRFETVQSKCLSPTTAVFFNTAATVPGLANDIPAFCTYATFSPDSVR